MPKNGSLKLADVDATVRAESDIVGWQQSLRAAMVNSVSEDDVSEIVKTQLAKAKEGDEKAIKFVFGTLLGSGNPVSIRQTNVITDPETAARLARGTG